VAETKHKQLVEALKKDILSGKYGFNTVFPSERALIRRYRLSRNTVQHALAELALSGFITRLRGRGTFVTRQGASRKIGLMMPGVAYSEFFPPIVSEVSRLAQRHEYALIFGDMSSKRSSVRAAQALKFARELVCERVAGVLFQPLEYLSTGEKVNGKLLTIFAEAKIPVVLIDSDVVPPPERSGYDLVGINNMDAGARLARHLLSVGARRIHFLQPPNSAYTVANRIRGVMTAVVSEGGEFSLQKNVLTAEPNDGAALARHLSRGRPDAFICANDDDAAVFKLTLEKAGLRIPSDLLLAGFDDVHIAQLLTPSLTSIHQPCELIAEYAFNRLLARIGNPDLQAVEIYLPSPLSVRASTGGRVKSKNQVGGS